MLDHRALVHRGAGDRHQALDIFTSFISDAAKNKAAKQRNDEEVDRQIDGASRSDREQNMKDMNAERTRQGGSKTQKQVRQEEDMRRGTAKGTPKPTPRRPLSCKYGKDYGEDCPQGFEFVPERKKKGYAYGHTIIPAKCQAPKGDGTPLQPGRTVYQGGPYTPPKGCKNVIPLKDLSLDKKQRLESMCALTWPCAEDPSGNGGTPGYHVDYDTRPDNICPSNWTFNPRDGTCNASSWYSGGCAKKISMLHWTKSMKKAWAHACMTEWPLVQKEGPSEEEVYRAEQAKRLAAERERAFGAAAIEEEEPLDPDADPRLELATKRKGVSDAVHGPSDPDAAVWAKCAGDYENKPCPMHWWIQADGTCLASEYYKGICPNRVNMQRWTVEMKRAFAKHCSADWPCSGEMYMDSVLPPSVSALMLPEWSQWRSVAGLGAAAQQDRAFATSGKRRSPACGVSSCLGRTFL